MGHLSQYKSPSAASTVDPCKQHCGEYADYKTVQHPAGFEVAPPPQRPRESCIGGRTTATGDIQFSTHKEMAVAPDGMVGMVKLDQIRPRTGNTTGNLHQQRNGEKSRDIGKTDSVVWHTGQDVMCWWMKGGDAHKSHFS